MRIAAGLAAILAALTVPPAATGAALDSPTTVPGCVLWLDAADVDGDGAADPAPEGVAVAQWSDKSGHGCDAAQNVPASQPVRARHGAGAGPVLRLRGDDFLVTPVRRDWSAEDWTVFAVASLDPDTPHNWRGVIGNRFGPGAAYWWTLGTMENGNLYLELGAGNGVVTQNFLVRDFGLQVYGVVKRGPNFALHRNGTVTGRAVKSQVGDRTNELRIGRWFGEGQEWQGEIAEIVIYDRALSDDERRSVESRLATKWGVTLWPDLYEKKRTWIESLIAAREARQRHPDSSAADRPDPGQDLWALLESDFADEIFRREMAWEREDKIWDAPWTPGDFAELGRRYAAASHRASGIRERAEALAPKANNLAALVKVRALYHRTRRYAETRSQTQRAVNMQALRRAIEDLAKTFPERYEGREHLRRLSMWERRLPDLNKALERGDPRALREAEELLAFQREALLANPLIDFGKLLLVRRSVKSPGLGLVQNWQSNCALPRSGFDDEIATLSPVSPGGELATLYRPEKPVFVGDVDLHFDAEKMLFSSIGTHDCWQIFEIGVDGAGLRQVTPGDQPDVDNYDACYLPDGRIIFSSTAFMVAVPCVNGSTRVANFYRMEPDGTSIRQLCFDQEHNWHPVVLNNGRVMYLRWEYTDTPHSHDRVLFHMNPDGTGQMEYYGSNSYWPNSLFYARPIPPTPGRPATAQFVGVVSGHHGVPRMGELVLFDPARGRREAEGAVQRIPGYGKKVEAIIADNLVDASWPKFLHPYPLSDKYFLVSSQPEPGSNWGVYLVDVFDNMLLLREEPGCALFEPIPLRKTLRPPVIPDKVDGARKDGVVYLSDVYAGGGLEGVPRGAVKGLRLFTYHFLYPGMGGPQAVVGMEGPWDIKRIMGTVPVEADGSAAFRVPANTPISVQPLDEEGKAVQLMRSWFTAMPGEQISCVGCHETQNSSPPARQTIASRRSPSEIAPWRGPTRGFNFQREVQPVLDKHCIGCHDGRARGDGASIPNLREQNHIIDYTSVFHHGGVDAGHFSVAYAELHRFVRRPGLESDYHMLTPMEFHADTTELVQILGKGHHGVQLDAEGWDRIITWIDLNAPYHGTWTEIAGEERVRQPAKRRRELLRLYADTDDDPEAIPASCRYVPPTGTMGAPSTSGPVARFASQQALCPSWPFDAAEAKRRQRQALRWERSIDLGDGVKMKLVRIPAGEFLMGSESGLPDERPVTRVRIEEPFWMGRFEVTNEQYACFDRRHDSGVESRFSMQFGVRGFYVNYPRQPVVRVSWKEAMTFCQWLSEKTGEAFGLPTEAQWEYACRAGAGAPFSYGGLDADFSPFANLADAKLREFVCHTYKKEREPWTQASKYDDWIPKDTRFNDGGFLSADVGNYLPNPWGLHDMHGNVWEWARSDFRPYPYSDGDGRNDLSESEKKVARGGSWRDRPAQCRSASRLAYRPYQRVYNVGFRVVCRATRAGADVARADRIEE